MLCKKYLHIQYIYYFLRILKFISLYLAPGWVYTNCFYTKYVDSHAEVSINIIIILLTTITSACKAQIHL